MGGGGAMRAAVKVASLGANGKLRGPSSLPLPEQSMATVGRNSTRQASVGIVSSPAIEEGVSPILIASQNGKSERSASVQRPSWEFDDWEFAGVEEELVRDSVRPMPPRVVFGPVPTLKEADEAASDLKDILQKECFPSNANGCRKSSKVFHEPILSVPSSSGCLETKDRVTSEDMVVRPVSKPVVQAFNLLKESSEAQSVVASLASDQNVWHAVMQNEKVVEFIKLHQSSTVTSISDEEPKLNDDQKFSKYFNNEFDGKDPEGSENVFTKLVQHFKLTVEKMVCNLSELIQNIFGGAADASVDSNESNAATNADKAIGASFMALAVMAIVVIVLKRA